MKLSTVFEKVRESLQIGEQKYICIALDNLSYCWHGGITETDYKRAIRVIHSRMEMKKFQRWVGEAYYLLEGYVFAETSLEWWLVWKGHIKVEDIDDLELQDAFYDYRLAWLDALIAEFKAKGD